MDPIYRAKEKRRKIILNRQGDEVVQEKKSESEKEREIEKEKVDREIDREGDGERG